ncbi:hypothetical protein [Sphingobacterium yanglingense]|uniref:Uncharacterized protein n=1 Tax=Sphingobacterium yanglingense TaxID=1437280 RepID=A0A4R6WSC0_9SPHI|nr:hypothetical protein [Sphingobacterium yanglingense]TDQ79596.1 hypothetical protein CLV99_1041 [Sphingobacterium yanglingense]
MKRIILSLIICTLINSCGLFKRTEKKVDRVKVAAVVEKSSESKTGGIESTNTQTQSKSTEQSKERQEHDINSDTKLEADEINIDSQGNISAKGGAKLTNKTNTKGKNEKDITKQDSTGTTIQADKISFEESNDWYKEQFKSDDTKKETVSSPSGKGIIFGAVSVLIIVFGVLWWFGVKRKK